MTHNYTIYIGFKPFSDHTDTIQHITNCLRDIKEWMFSNFLKLNISKTKASLIGSKNNTLYHPKIDTNYDDQLIENPPEGYMTNIYQWKNKSVKYVRYATFTFVGLVGYATTWTLS